MSLPDHAPHGGGPRRGRWRLALPAATACAGALLATAYGADVGDADLRVEARRTDLAALVADAGEQVETLTARAARLQRQVDQLTAQQARRAAGATGAAEQARLTQRVDALREQAGLAPVSGPGLTVVLDDAPDRAIDAVGDAADGLEGAASSAGTVTVSDLVVHQQDIQAVANALWEGGAEAMTIRGQRVVATTGIKCVGNSVILHGVPYSPPYDIAAVGDPAALRSALQESTYVRSYREVAAAYGLGYVVLGEETLRMPAYTGATALRHARATAG